MGSEDDRAGGDEGGQIDSGEQSWWSSPTERKRIFTAGELW